MKNKNQNLNSIKNITLLFFIGLLFTPAHGSFLDKSVKFVGNHKKLALFLAGAALIVYRAKKVRNKIKEIDQEIDKEKIQNAQNEKNEQTSKLEIFKRMIYASFIGDAMGVSTEFFQSDRPRRKYFENDNEVFKKEGETVPQKWNNFYPPHIFNSTLYKKYTPQKIAEHRKNRIEKISFSDDSLASCVSLKGLSESNTNGSLSYQNFIKILAQGFQNEYQERDKGIELEQIAEDKDTFIVPGIHLTCFTQLLAPGRGMKKAASYLTNYSTLDEKTIKPLITKISNDADLCGSGLGMRCFPHAAFPPYQAAVTTMLNGQLTHNKIGSVPSGLQAALYSAIVRNYGKDQIYDLMILYAKKFAPTLMMKLEKTNFTETTLLNYIESTIQEAEKVAYINSDEKIAAAKSFFEIHTGNNALTLFLSSLYTYFARLSYKDVSSAIFQSSDIDCDTLLASCLAIVAAQGKEFDTVMLDWKNVINAMDDDIILEHASSGKNTFGKEEFKYKDNIKITSLPLEKSQMKRFINEGAQKLFDIYEKQSSFINDSSYALEVGENVTLEQGVIEAPAGLNLPTSNKKVIKKENPYMRFIKLFLP